MFFVKKRSQQQKGAIFLFGLIAVVGLLISFSCVPQENTSFRTVAPSPIPEPVPVPVPADLYDNSQNYYKQPYQQPTQPYQRPRSRSYRNPYDIPPQNNYYPQYYDLDQYYVPPSQYRNIEPNQYGPGGADSKM